MKNDMDDTTPSSNPPRTHWTLREIIAAVLTAGVIIGLVIHGWTGKTQKAREQNASAVQDEFELRYFDIQAKLFVGLTNKNKDAAADSSTIAAAAISNLISDGPPDKFILASKAKYRARQAVLADLLNRPSVVSERLSDVAKYGPPYDGLSNDLKVTLANKDLDHLPPDLEGLLGWTAGLVTKNRERAVEQASSLTHKVTSAGLVFSGCAVVGLSTLIILLFLRFTGKMRFRFFEGPLPRAIRLEIFLVYMAIMTGASFAVSNITSWELGLSQLDANILIMALIPLAVFVWPLVQRYSLRDTLVSLGLHPTSLGKLLGDLAVAPFFYLATWVILLPCLMVYALIVKLLGFDMSQGAHPIFSWLIQDKDPIMFYKIAFLAVVVAPILEEITFRGAFYSWLRARLEAPTAIVMTAFVFAVIHPQGPLGVIPLMGIAIAFGILREWRGSLYAPILAHACFNGGTLLLFQFATRL